MTCLQQVNFGQHRQWHCSMFGIHSRNSILLFGYLKHWLQAGLHMPSVYRYPPWLCTHVSDWLPFGAVTPVIHKSELVFRKSLFTHTHTHIALNTTCFLTLNHVYTLKGRAHVYFTVFTEDLPPIGAVPSVTAKLHKIIYDILPINSSIFLHFIFIYIILIVTCRSKLMNLLPILQQFLCV